MDFTKAKESLKKALENAMHLDIRTIIGPLQLDDTNKVSKEVDPNKIAETKAIITSINLVTGDITTKMDEEFVTGDYQSLRSFHQEQEKKGNEIILKNLEVMKNLIVLLREKIDDEPVSNNEE